MEESNAFCPITKDECKENCALYCYGECGLKVISERMIDAITAINDIKWTISNAKK